MTTTMTTSIVATSPVTNNVHGSKSESDDSQQQVQQQVQQNEIVEECPICCNSMSISDIQYPLVCPTKSCYYNYCSICILNFIKAAADGYQLASDGSYQMKITVKCPMCRSKYQNVTSNTNTTTSQSQQSHHDSKEQQHHQQHLHSSDSSNKIVQSIIILRNAIQMELLLQTDDCLLNASQLAKRDEYIRTVTMDILDDAYTTIQSYNNSLSHSTKYDNNTTSNSSNTDHHIEERNLTVRPVNSILFHSILQPNNKDHRLSDYTTGINNNNNSISDITKELQNNNINNNSTSMTTTIIAGSTIAWKDPTILGGLEELMTVSEHEFITSMMISGQTETIAQAASILDGILHMSTTKRIATATVTVTQSQQPSPSTNGTNSNRKTTTNNARTESSNRPVRLSVRDIEHINRMKRRFPLPINMPRCVTVPVYDPLLELDSKSSSKNHQNTVFNFVTDTKDKTKLTLQLKNINGYAGKVGLRKNDIITHIDNIAIDTYDEFINIMSCRYNNHSCSEFNTYETQSQGQDLMPTVEIVVNATHDVANSLQQRYYQMQKEKIRFLYN